jgi:tRNA U34 5-methylaminomethyl-2-thiouridine-forming methyltransferase MnmC
MPQNRIFETQDGSHSVMSEEYGVSYHSRYGAVQESRHVFVGAGLHYKSLRQKNIAVLEFGFGTGLNAWLSLLEAAKHDLKIYYEALEAFPITEAEAQTLNYPTLLQAEDQAATFLKMHACPWGESVELAPGFTFKKMRQRFEEADYHEQFDVVYFDAFAPNAQPELWERAVLEVAYRALRKDGVLVTYCAKGSVKRTFRDLGFEVEAMPGPPGKREMTRCIKN